MDGIVGDNHWRIFSRLSSTARRWYRSHDGGVVESRTADDIRIAGSREHVGLTALELHEGAIVGINVMGFCNIQRHLMAPADDQVAMITLVDAFAEVSSTV